MSVPISGAQLRIARPTDNIDALRNFYCNGVGFDVVWEFQDHEGFDGLMLGLESMGYHLEFTRKQGHEAGRAPTESVQAFNPYWDVRGRTFEDPDGYRVVFQNAAWANKGQKSHEEIPRFG